MKKVLLLLVLSFSFSFIFAQKNVIDKIVAIVGDEIILQSDIENAFLQQQGQGIISSSPDYKAEILEQQLVQKLLMAQAQIDSIIVSLKMPFPVRSNFLSVISVLRNVWRNISVNPSRKSKTT